MSKDETHPAYRYLKKRVRDNGPKSLLNRLSSYELERFHSEVLDTCIVRTIKRGGLLLSELSPNQPVYLLQDGRVKITQSTYHGPAIMDYKTTGDFVGEVDALSGGYPSHSAKAIESTRTWEIPSQRFTDYITRNPVFALTAIAHLSCQIVDLRRFANQHKGKVPERLAQRLLDLGLATYPGIDLDSGFKIRTTQRELAGAVGATLSKVEIDLRELRRAKVVRTGRGVVHVDDPAYLVKLLDTADIELPSSYIQRFLVKGRMSDASSSETV